MWGEQDYARDDRFVGFFYYMDDGGKPIAGNLPQAGITF
jgi:hypothetical protein